MMRIQKMIASKSDYSRRKAEELIADGKVFLNGQKVTEMGVLVDETDEIIINNEVLYKRDLVYYLLNKPTHVISSTTDDKERETVIELIDTKERIYPVGRLDYLTTGLLLLTNDGYLANKLMHPSQEIEKIYRVKIKGDFTKEKAEELARGVEIEGRMTAPANVKIKKRDKKAELTDVEISLHEGRNRQVRKMVESVDCRVINLKRIKYAFFEIENEKMQKGDYRELTVKEVKRLYNLVDND